MEFWGGDVGSGVASEALVGLLMQILNVVGNQNKALDMPPHSSATMLSVFKACCDANPVNRYTVKDQPPSDFFSFYLKRYLLS